jgi:hypothetical protein
MKEREPLVVGPFEISNRPTTRSSFLSGRRINGHSPPSGRCIRSRNAHTRSSVCRDGHAYRLGTRSFWARRLQAGPGALRCAHSAVHQRDDRVAHFPDPAVGGVLPMAVLSFVGSSILFLNKQLLDGRLWGCDSTADVANPGAGGKPHRCAHVWPFCELVVRHRDPARRSRGPILTETEEIFGSAGIYSRPFDRFASSRFHAVTIALKRDYRL